MAIFNNITITDYSSGMRYFFDKGRILITKQNVDPAGYGGNIGNYIDTSEKVEEAVSRFQSAFDRAIKAEAFEKQGYINNAIDEWRKIFGDYFPSYG